MSEDPISKSKLGPGMGPRDIIPKSAGPGSINTTKDYSSQFTSLRSRIFYVIFCFIPYIAVCVFVYLEILEVLGIFLLAVPLVLLSLFWLLKRKLG